MWGSDPAAQELLATLIACYVVERTNGEKFNKEESPFLRRLSNAFPGLRSAISDIQIAYSGEIPIMPAGRFRIWSDHGWKGREFASLLQMIGDDYEQRKENRSALARYAAAWSITNEPKYALSTASLLSADPSLDPGDRLLNALLDPMFMEKGMYYEHNDWPNILRMHVAIGTILETRGAWGDSGSPRTAIYQWEHAVVAEGHVRAEKADLPPLAGVHMHLANCYSRAQKPEKAGGQYVIAAESYMQAGDYSQALQATKLAHQFGGTTLSPSIQARLYRVEESIERRCPGPGCA